MAKSFVASAARLAGFLIAACLALPAAAQNTSVKFTLDWKVQGPNSPFVYALRQGYYEAEGLNVTIDAGKGSAGAVTRVASGAYDMGFADINSLIEYNAQNPDRQIKAVMILYDAPPFSLLTLRAKGIAKPADLEGRTLGAPVFDASYKLFPAFAAATGIDPDKVKKQNMDPALREAMLVRGEVDVISGHYSTSFLDLKSKGIKADDIVVMRYPDYGLDFYGNGVIVSPEMLSEHPEAIAGFIRATIKGLEAVIADPEAGVAAIKAVDPLIDEAIELERFKLALETNILTPAVRENGVGGVDMARLARSVDQVAIATPLPRKPTPEEIFTAEFLPPQAERMLQ